MKKLIILMSIVLSLGSAHAQKSSDLSLFFKLTDFYFRKYVHNGLVNYQFAKSNAKELNGLKRMIGEVDLSGATPAEKKAFYINSYNLLVISQIAEIYPIARPLDQAGFFNGKTHIVAGNKMTLDQLEKAHMLSDFKDPRFHFVLACAAMSCPKLANFAYKPQHVEKMLQQRTIAALNDNSFIKVDKASQTVHLSKIFDWYKGDFVNDFGSVLDYINKYRKNKIPAGYKVKFYEYNWQLNERRS